MWCPRRADLGFEDPCRHLFDQRVLVFGKVVNPRRACRDDSVVRPVGEDMNDLLPVLCAEVLIAGGNAEHVLDRAEDRVDVSAQIGWEPMRVSYRRLPAGC